jgi:hypothetical protein
MCGDWLVNELFTLKKSGKWKNRDTLKFFWTE